MFIFIFWRRLSGNSNQCEEYTNNIANVCYQIKIYNSNGDRDFSRECVFDFDDNSCKSKLRNCKDEKDDEICNKMVLSDDKRCLWDGDSCVEFYKDCENYKGDNRETCEKIQPFKSMYEIDDDYECVFENESGCMKKK